MMYLTPVDPIIKGSCDSTDSPNGILHLIVALDSENQLFIQRPLVSGIEVKYLWYYMSKSIPNYPKGDIIDINCSIIFPATTIGAATNSEDSTSGSGMKISIVAVSDSIYLYTANYSPKTGLLSKNKWQVESPSGTAWPPLPTLI